MNAQARVLAVCEFKAPDRIPRCDSFWDFTPAWREALGPPEALTDVKVWCPNEATFPGRKRRLKEEGGYIYEVDDWGRTVRFRPEAYFEETLAVPLADAAALDATVFEPANLETRYLQGAPDAAALRAKLSAAKQSHCLFGKTGGPFLRSTFVRGEEQFLADIAEDPGLASALAEKMGAHLTAVGVEEIQRWALQETGLWIYDDIAFNDGPLISPRAFEKIFLPIYRKMISAFKRAGARYVFFHSDGDIRLLLDMLVDAGIDGLNPLERRAGMDPVALRKRYPCLILAGGMCNSHTLVEGPVDRIRAEARELLGLGRHGGLIIGAHSISPEVPLEHFRAYHELCQTEGVFSGGPAHAAARA